MNTVTLVSVFILGFGLVLIGAVSYVLLFPPSQAMPLPPTVELTVTITIIGGGARDGFGFGLKGEEIESPGPEIRTVIREEVKDLRTYVDDRFKAFDEKFKAFDEELKALDERVVSLRNEMNARLGNLEGKVDVLQRAAVLEAEVRVLKQRLNSKPCEV